MMMMTMMILVTSFTNVVQNQNSEYHGVQPAGRGTQPAGCQLCQHENQPPGVVTKGTCDLRVKPAGLRVNTINVI